MIRKYKAAGSNRYLEFVDVKKAYVPKRVIWWDVRRERILKEIVEHYDELNFFLW